MQADLASKLRTVDLARKNAESQNDSLTSNKAAFMQKLKGSESRCAALSKENDDLREQASLATSTILLQSLNLACLM